MYGQDVEMAQGELSVPSSMPGPTVSITGRRVALLVGGLVALWLVGVFARQVGEAATAANEADQMRVRNAAMQRDVTSLEAELNLVRQPAYSSEMARAYFLGTPLEVPFTLDPNAPPLPANAPGSAGIKPQVDTSKASPLESWLKILFGSEP
jgi:hypothetical protein